MKKSVSVEDAFLITVNLFKEAKEDLDTYRKIVEDLAACEDHMESCPAYKYMQDDGFECDCFDHNYYNFENMINVAREALAKEKE